MNVLLIIDPQNDFISGSMAVNGAAQKMDYLVGYLEAKSDEWDAVVVTMDQHPYNHCSFLSEGGEWPRHCVKYTLGASIYPPLAEALGKWHQKSSRPLLYLEKATIQEKDAYSAFEKEIPDLLLTADRIAVAGIAGDYCVKESVKDLTQRIDSYKIELIKEAIPYIFETKDCHD